MSKPIINVAIIAHVDHGKTTLVDTLLKAGGIFNQHEEIEERVMDSNDQEKERGITIYAKNASIEYKGTKINIIDTPGHADFGSEVERVLRTVDATLLLVDAYEGPMPQTKFVLSKSLELGLPVFVIINKIDKPSARPDAVIDMVFDLFAKLNASEKQLDFPYMYTIARDGIALRNLNDEHTNITPLLDFIIEHTPQKENNTEAPFRMQPATLKYDNFLGRIAVGRVYDGKIQTGKNIKVINSEGEIRNKKISKLFTYEGLERKEVDEVVAGDIVAIAGIDDIYVGETIVTDENTKALPSITIDPPSLAMYFMVNNSPFAGREGKYVTSRHIRDRLFKEMETNVGLKVEETSSGESFKVYGRGEMHLAVLIEDMRREGFELQVSQPEVILRDIDGVSSEPIENVMVNLPDDMSGKIIEALSLRKGELKNMASENGTTNLEFEVPTRGLLGFRSTFIILTKGEGIMYHAFDHYAPQVGKIAKRTVGSLISGNTGKTVGFALFNLQNRGPLFLSTGVEIYEGMVVGEHNQGTDLVVNPLKEKKLTNVRASGTDEAIKLIPPIPITLEKALEYIQEDEYVEITPENIRLRKKHLTEVARKRNK
jgi:GTP-binding protein